MRQLAGHIGIAWRVFTLSATAAFFASSAVLAGGDAGVPEAGQRTAQQLCSKCHAVGVTGDSPFKPAPPFRTFAKKYPLEYLEEALAEGITVGHPAMPEFTFSPRQIDDFIAYLRTLN